MSDRLQTRLPNTEISQTQLKAEQIAESLTSVSSRQVNPLKYIYPPSVSSLLSKRQLISFSAHL